MKNLLNINFETTEDYTGSVKPPFHAIFPRTVTNKFKINEHCLDEVIELVAKQILYEGWRIRFVSFSSAEFDEMKTSDDKEISKQKRYREIHKKATFLISGELGLSESDFKISYDLFETKDRCVALYLDYNNSANNMARLLRFAEKLSEANEEGYKASPKQKFLQSLIMLYFKTIIINDSNDRSHLYQSGLINLNSDVHCLIKTTEDEDEEGKKCIAYHTLKPTVTVTAYNEVVCRVVRQKHISPKLNSDLTQTDGVDFVFISNPSKFKKNSDYSKASENGLVKVNANEGETAINYFSMNNITNCTFFYSNLFTRYIDELFEQSGIDYEWVKFKPTLRTSTFISYEEQQVKKPIEFVVVTPDFILDEKAKIKVKIGEEGKGKNKKDIYAEYEYVKRDALNAFLGVFIEKWYSDYQTRVTFNSEVKYSDLDPSIDYIFIQESAPTAGYWAITQKDNFDILKNGDKYDITKNIGTIFRADETYKTNIRSTSFLKIYNEAFEGINKNPYFLTDRYTSIKVDDFHHRVNKSDATGGLVLQGYHLPNFGNLASFCLVNDDRCHHKDLLSDRADMVLENEKNKHEKIKVDLLSKRLVVNNSKLPLVYSDKSAVKLKEVDGKYRCYFISKTRLDNKKGTLFYASYMDVLVEDGEIIITGKGIKTTESSVVSDAKYPLSKSIARSLLNDSFYIVDEDGSALVCYTGYREQQPLSGIYKGRTFIDYVISRYKESEDPTKPLKLGSRSFEGERGAMLGFYMLSSANNDSFSFLGNSSKSWLFLEPLETKDIMLYVSEKNSMNSSISKPKRTYRLLVKDKNGIVVDTMHSKLASLYLQTATYNVNSLSTFSFRSILHTLTKIVLNN